MNVQRRKDIAALVARMAELEALRDTIRDDIDVIMGEEQDYLDNMPESLQSGDKGEKAQTAIDALQNAYQDLDMVDIEAIVGYLEEAQE